jgi:hypothetical protein
LVVLLLAALVFTAACSDDDSEPVEFGEGEIPSAFPDDFPVPGGASIGATLVDRINNRSEFSFQVRAALPTMMQFFTFELVNEGYVVDSSDGDAEIWEIAYSRDDLMGTIVLRPAGADLSQGVASVNGT